MNLQEIKTAVNEGYTVHVGNEAYTVIKDIKDQWLIKHYSGDCIGLYWTDGVTLNAEEKDFFINY